VPSRWVNSAKYQSATFSLEASVYTERAAKTFLAFYRNAPWKSRYTSLNCEKIKSK
jgi:hypothetical protein